MHFFAVIIISLVSPPHKSQNHMYDYIIVSSNNKDGSIVIGGGYFSKCSNAVIICEPPNKAGIRNDWQMSIKKLNFEKRRFRL